MAAAAGALAAADETALGRDSYALARPPGHHAYAARAGGHCYLNNAAHRGGTAAGAWRAAGGGAGYRQPSRQRHAGAVLEARRRAVHLGAWRSQRLLPLVCRPRGRAGRGRRRWVQPQLPAGRGDGGSRLAGGGGRGAAGDRAVRRGRAGGQPRVRRVAGRAAALTSRCPPRGSPAPAPRSAGLALPATFIQEGGYNADTLGPLLQTFFTAFVG